VRQGRAPGGPHVPEGSAVPSRSLGQPSPFPYTTLFRSAEGEQLAVGPTAPSGPQYPVRPPSASGPQTPFPHQLPPGLRTPPHTGPQQSPGYTQPPRPMHNPTMTGGVPPNLTGGLPPPMS